MNFTDRNEFIKQLGNIAIQDYALEDEELDVEVRGVAAAIRDYTRGVIGALNYVRQKKCANATLRPTPLWRTTWRAMKPAGPANRSTAWRCHRPP
ncbi:MAG: hypothetical protein NDI77_12570 [Geobacteraceae bacterium]|nr:hypothetical protein [Geobacteraceae bacterium]